MYQYCFSSFQLKSIRVYRYIKNAYCTRIQFDPINHNIKLAIHLDINENNLNSTSLFIAYAVNQNFDTKL